MLPSISWRLGQSSHKLRYFPWRQVLNFVIVANASIWSFWLVSLDHTGMLCGSICNLAQGQKMVAITARCSWDQVWSVLVQIRREVPRSDQPLSAFIAVPPQFQCFPPPPPYKNHTTKKRSLSIPANGAFSFIGEQYYGAIFDQDLTIKRGLWEIPESVQGQSIKRETNGCFLLRGKAYNFDKRQVTVLHERKLHVKDTSMKKTRAHYPKAFEQAYFCYCQLTYSILFVTEGSA